MPAITLEAIKAKQTELEKLIQQFSEQPTAVGRIIEIEDHRIELEPGEHYAGAVLDADGKVMHHLVLMAQRPDEEMTWQAAMDWVASIGGVLPTRQEQSLLFANCKPHLQPKWHWSCETHDGDASCAWVCIFFSGSVGTSRKSCEGSAVAVRRV